MSVLTTRDVEAIRQGKVYGECTTIEATLDTADTKPIEYYLGYDDGYDNGYDDGIKNGQLAGKSDNLNEYQITLEKLIKITHTYTTPIRVYVVMHDARFTCEEAKRMHDFILLSYHGQDRGRSASTMERINKYYKDAPVWNLTVWVEPLQRLDINNALHYGIDAKCHYKDIREGWLAEQADIKREKRRQYRKKKKEG